MTDARVIADHWARGDVYGLAASVDLADRLPVKAGHHLVDIGCGPPAT